MLNKHLLKIIVLFLFGFANLQAQVTYTAKDKIPSFKGPFGYGSNMGYFPNWTDEELADIAIGNQKKGQVGAGVRCLRPALFEHFLEDKGYDFRIPTFQHYQQLGAQNNTAFIGFPSSLHREKTNYCPGKQSELFANLYTPIWDNGENGTPINEDNFYANYLYQMVSRYQAYVTFWEIWNEPDFDYSGNAWKTADLSGNWWTNNPDPCDYKLHAPIFHYVRMLRISYEVIKTIDPEALVAIGGLGYPSFLDAVMRNTDNPNDGSMSKEFPHQGGAYFDVMSFHTYPHIDGSLQTWDAANNKFNYHRNSDQAVLGVVKIKKQFEEVLKKYKYGFQHPQKHFIITEFNIPRKQFGSFIGSEAAQRNFLIKTFIELQKENVQQCYIYDLADNKRKINAKNEFDLMGLYQHLTNEAPIKNTLATAFKTTADLLHGYQLDKIQTQDLQLPAGVNGAAFNHPDKEAPVYVLWAITTVDQSEKGEQVYTFPYAFHATSMSVKQWDYSSTNESIEIPSTSIFLNGNPVFIELHKKLPSNELPLLETFPNPFNELTHLTINIDKSSTVSLSIHTLEGTLLQTIVSSQNLSPGTFQYQFNPKDASEVYICQLKIGNKTYLSKLVKAR